LIVLIVGKKSVLELSGIFFLSEYKRGYWYCFGVCNNTR